MKSDWDRGAVHAVADSGGGTVLATAAMPMPPGSTARSSPTNWSADGALPKPTA